MTARRGRPPRLARDIAVLLAVEWHRRAEGLAAVDATRAVRELWHAKGRVGLGKPAAESRAAFGCMRRAAKFLGDGRVVVLPGIDAGPVLTGAAAFFVPSSSMLRQVGLRQAIHGAFWRWSFDLEEAEYLAGSNGEAESAGRKSNFVYRASSSAALQESFGP